MSVENFPSELVVSHSLYNLFSVYCERRLPYESGGFLFAHAGANHPSVLATHFIGLETAFFSERKFVPYAQYAIQAILSREKVGQELVATVHSHPEGSSLPSLADLHFAAGYPSNIHVIISYVRGAPSWNAYVITREGNVQSACRFIPVVRYTNN